MTEPDVGPTTAAEHLQRNRAMWDERAAPHAASPDYRVADLVADPGRISAVVAFDRPRLGDLTGLDVVHLQCHIGTDTLSLARLGGRLTGLDFSAASIAEATALAERGGAQIDYRVSDVYGAVEALGGGRFDLVYTGIGALIWLPDLTRWAQVVAALLRPGGRLFVRDGHPMLLALDLDRTDGRLVVEHPYLPRREPTLWTQDSTYVETDATFTRIQSAEWSHGLGEIVSAVLDAGLELTALVEHDSLPWRALPQLVGGADGEFRLVDRPERLPLSFTLEARRPTTSAAPSGDAAPGPID